MMVWHCFTERFSFHLFFLLSLMTYTVVGQEDYKEGHVVTLKGDTLYGRLSDRKLGPFGGIHDKIKFRGKRLKKRFSPDQVLSYKKGDSIYRSLFLDGETEFLRVVSEGFVSLYMYELQEQGKEMVVDISYLKKEKSSDLVRADQGLLGLKRKAMTRFFDDCPPLVKKIQDKQFKYAYQLVDYYNEWKKR